MSSTIAVLGSYDTKWQALEFLSKHIKAMGLEVLRIDVSLGREAGVPTDVDSSEVARAADTDISEIRNSTDTEFATRIMVEGAKRIVANLHSEERIQGIISIGGASNTGLATKVMGSLPFGVPKFMVSSMAAVPAYAGSYFGTKDLTMLHSVVDIAEQNPLLENILIQAAGAVCGMVRAGAGVVNLGKSASARPRVAITEFKFSEICCRHATKLLTQAGVEVIPFHAQGIGDRALEELIGEGLIDGVLDIVPAGLAEELLGGNRSAGPARLEAAARMGIPQVVTPCGMDMLSCGPLERGDNDDPLWVSRKLSKRKLFVPDALRVQARTTSEELLLVAEVLAEKLIKSKGPVHLLIPERGWSSLSQEGGPLCDFEADKVFTDRITERLRGHCVVSREDVALNTEEFARIAVDALLGSMAQPDAGQSG